MAGALLAAGLGIGAGDLCLVVICWKRRTVLGGICGTVGIALAVFAIAPESTDGAEVVALILALAALVIGTVLFGLGQVLQRVLDQDPEDV